MSRDDEEDEDHEEFGGGSQLLGFMFGNVDNSGDLDIDYLDEDAKEHLAALADKLGPSLADIDLIRSSPVPIDASEQDYDEKAEDAIDYEDIDEQYDGPEVQNTTEEDHLLPKSYFTSNTLLASLHNNPSVFDEENYDEDEENLKTTDVEDKLDVKKSGSEEEPLELISAKEFSLDDNLPNVPSEGEDMVSGPNVPSEGEDMVSGPEEIQEEDVVEPERNNSTKTETSLPVLCVEDGMVILKFSEIFGMHEPQKRPEKKDRSKCLIRKDRFRSVNVTDVEDDEEIVLRGSLQNLSIANNYTLTIDVVGNDMEHACDAGERMKDACLYAQPMKVDKFFEHIYDEQSTLCPDIYPLIQQDWEDDIIWGNSPTASQDCLESCVASEYDCEDITYDDLGSGQRNGVVSRKEINLLNTSTLENSFPSRELSCSFQNRYSEKSSHPQIQGSDYFPIGSENENAEMCKSNASQLFNKPPSLNKDLLEGSWLDHIIWDSSEDVPKPKLILDLQDNQMLFEVLDQSISEDLRRHAGAMVISRSLHPSADDSFDLHTQGISSFGRFNISNDKYYSNRKVSQQAKSHAKKRALSSIKVFHAVPALKLETMKPKLSNKEIANFHRPKALWFPPCNEILAKVHGALREVGPMKIILMSLGGKPIKFNVNAEESLSSIKLRASKKLDMKQSENARVFYFGRELNDGMSLAAQGIQPNSVLHVVRTRIHLWPRAQKLPGENKPLRPPGAFKKKSELSVKEGHVFLMEYCEERPLLLGNVGMGARLCTYYQKTTPSDQTASTLRNENSGFGAVLALDPADKSPFLGDISSGCSQTSLETNMYRAPAFSHKLASTDFLLVRSAKGILSLRRIDKLYVVGQQEPHMEVFSPGTKNVQTYLVNRMLVYIYREFLMKEKPGLLPCIRNDELISQFPGLTEPFIRKRLKHCADPKKSSHGQLLWVKKSDFRIPSEEELRRMLAPENVCSYESMQAGLYRLKHLGISRLTHPIGLSTAMNQLPDEAIALAAASHIERELQITSWNLTSNFVACTNQDRENIERLEITGVGDPSGRGLGFSYVRVPTKAPISNATAKKKAAAAKGGTTVTGTDADLRRLSMDAAREVLLKFNVPEEQIDKLTRWHRIALVRKLSSEQAASGVTVEAPMLNKFARGQRMSFLQLQQQTREKCQEIWDRQIQNLSAIDGDENDSDSEPHSDLDSFAGDLENLLDAEEYDEEDDGNTELKGEKGEAIRGLKMRRCPSQAQAEEELEDNEVEAALIRRLLEGDSSDLKKKKKLKTVVTSGSHLVTQNAETFKKSNNMLGQSIRMSHPDASFVSKDTSTGEPKEVERLRIERNLSLKLKPQKGNGAYDDMSTGVARKKSVLAKDGTKVLKEKKPGEKPVREGFVCGACGQIGHMRTNKNCPKYGEEAETSELETISGKPNVLDVTAVQMKTPSKKAPKLSVKTAELELPENVGTVGLKTLGKVIPVKFKCRPAEKPFEKSLLGAQTSDKQIPDAQTDSKSSIKIGRIIISNKKTEDTQHEVQKPSVVIRLPIDTEKDQPRKKIIIKHPKVTNSMERDRQTSDFEMDDESRKMKKIAELSSSGKHKMQESEWLTEEVNKRDPIYGRRLWDEEAKQRNKEMMPEDRSSRRIFEDERRQEHHWRSFENIEGYEETIRKSELKKGKKKKKVKPDFKDEYLLEHRPSRNVRKIPERDRAVKKRTSIDSSQSDYAPSAKRRRGGEVELSNILENIVESLRSAEVSYLFRKPVTKKEAPDYFDVVKHPMDLSTIRDKVRSMDYRSREDFRHDIWQITYNAHTYNDKRNPHIPPLADQLLELCDYHLEERHEELSDAEEAIKF